MEKSISTETYLKNILNLQRRNGHVRAVDIATEVGVSKPSVSAAVKKLKENKMIYIDGNGFICLTKTGKALAENKQKKTVRSSCARGVGGIARCNEDTCGVFCHYRCSRKQDRYGYFS